MSCITTADIVNQQHVAPSTLQVNTKRIRALAQEIRNSSDPDRLMLSMGLSGNEMSDMAKDLAAEAASLSSQYLPIASPPSPNPISIVKWISKFTVGSIAPQLHAFISLVAQAVAFAAAVEDLMSAINTAQSKLKNAPTAILTKELNAFSGTIHKTMYQAQSTINNAIANTYCSALQGAGLSQGDLTNALRSYDAISALVSNTSTNLNAVNSSATASLVSVQGAVSAISSVANVTSLIDTSSITGLTTSVSNGAVNAFSSSVTSALNEPAPECITIPTISGTISVGQTISTDGGTWSANTQELTYQWQSGGSDIAGATNQTYKIAASDAGQVIRVGVTATNQLNATTVYSSNTATPTYPPQCTAAPVIMGIPAVDQFLYAFMGIWSGDNLNPPTYQWQANGINIAGATNGTYAVSSAYVGQTLTVVVTVSNSDGTNTATSQATSAVTT